MVVVARVCHRLAYEEHGCHNILELGDVDGEHMVRLKIDDKVKHKQQL